MLKPHGSDTLNPLYVADDAKRAALVEEAKGLKSIVVSSAAAGNAVMMASGYFNPLTGFMNLADSLAISEKMVTTGVLFFPVPLLNVVEDASGIEAGMRIDAVHLLLQSYRNESAGPNEGRRIGAYAEAFRALADGGRYPGLRPPAAD